MKKHRTVTVCIFSAIFALVLLGAGPALWAAPMLMNYSGKLVDNESQPVTNGSLPMKFRIYDGETGGAMKWGESQTVNVQTGFYSVLLGSGTPLDGSGSLDATVFTGDMRYLEVEVNGTVLVPRQRIASVAYALQTAVAGTVQDGAITSAKIANGTITGANIANGTIAAAKIIGGPGSGVDADTVDGSHASAFGSASDVSTLKSQVATLQSQVATLQGQMAAMNTLLSGVTRSGNDFIFTGMNVHIRNGQSTETTNSYGNLIVGYNELRGSGDVRTGSHNIIVGKENNYSSYGGLVAGTWNNITGQYASVSGGVANTASGNFASVSGGQQNTASGGGASISGGWNNTASGVDSSVSGGTYNTASGLSSFAGGGGGPDSIYGNKAFADYSATVGGSSNLAGDPGLSSHTIGQQSSVSGGVGNTASGNNASVSGGWNNTASGEVASASGGYHNTASNSHASVSGGYYNTASGGDASVSGGTYNTASSAYASVSGGGGNTASGLSANVSGGAHNTASGSYSFVGGGGGASSYEGNIAFADYSAVLGGAVNLAGDSGLSNHTIGQGSSVSGGVYNVAKGSHTSVSGGINNTASGGNASVSGGNGNTASGQDASVSGGFSRTASGTDNWVGGGYWQDH